VITEDLIRVLRTKGWKMATAESCTGGMVAAAITDIAGSSDVFDRGFVTYSNEAKSDMLGVPPALITQHGAVSEAVARAMAEGALKHSLADVAVAVTGVAGPGGGSVAKPVGLVHFACATKLRTVHLEMRFGDVGRAAVRNASVAEALQLVFDAL
jgi:nicotinamide-nucleotide amidase